MFKAFRARMRRIKDQLALLEQLRAPLEELPGGQHQWIQDSMDWFVEQFGRDVLRRPIALPSTFIPAGYDGSEAAARELFEQVREWMGVPAGQLAVRFDLDDLDPGLVRTRPRPELAGATRLRFGLWVPGKNGNTVYSSARLLGEPTVLVANFAHEIGHELLVGARRISSARPDQESLTDLLAVFQGFGIFLANASFGQLPGGERNATMAMFYLRERALSDALAYYAFRQDVQEVPPWEDELDWPVRIGLVARLEKLQDAAQPGK
ncbi:hypothetical protein [Streptomyces sp. SID13031]|uniref:hypothetical protein n=1 Tax=Streptomyces sp. SID13031 TaxID=2706046 RepID=UPI0013CA8C9B|nr:hypothetical protein [Streptomyces sp. SID13031]NEA32072.1 hypothetical protein [Streptomyces sp. SID13031]